jgi:voltage-gated potassium channel
MEPGRSAEPVGGARSPEDAAVLERFNQRMALPLVLAAVVPLFLVPGGMHSILVSVVFVVSWLVFVVDLVVHERRLVHYLRTWLGRFDLAVVLLTARSRTERNMPPIPVSRPTETRCGGAS